MDIYILENEYLRIEASDFGAELQSIRSKTTDFEYLWHGDKAYWARRSPILFPIVGKVWDGRMKYCGEEYPLSQHGFARDCEFTKLDEKQMRVRKSVVLFCIRTKRRKNDIRLILHCILYIV